MRAPLHFQVQPRPSVCDMPFPEEVDAYWSWGFDHDIAPTSPGGEVETLS